MRCEHLSAHERTRGAARLWAGFIAAEVDAPK
jgi:hypothetical protein